MPYPDPEIFSSLRPLSERDQWCDLCLGAEQTRLYRGLGVVAEAIDGYIRVHNSSQESVSTTDSLRTIVLPFQHWFSAGLQPTTVNLGPIFNQALQSIALPRPRRGCRGHRRLHQGAQLITGERLHHRLLAHHRASVSALVQHGASPNNCKPWPDIQSGPRKYCRAMVHPGLGASTAVGTSGGNESELDGERSDNSKEGALTSKSGGRLSRSWSRPSSE